MSRVPIGPFVAAIVISVAVTAPGAAQPVTTFAQLPLHLDEGDRVRIVGTDGVERTGSISALAPTTIGVEVDGTVVRFNAADVREIAVPDGFRNGVLIGVGAGSAVGLAAGVMLTSGDDDPITPAIIILSTAAGAGAGVGIGITIDALKRHYRILYRAPASTVFRMLPVVAPGQGYGALLSVRW